MSYTLVMLPPQTEVTRAWAKRIAADQVARVVIAEDLDQARRAIVEAEAAYGTLPPAAAGRGPPPALAPGSAGRAPRRVVLPGADRPPGGRHQLPRDLQRPHRRPHHGLRAGLRPRAARTTSRASCGASGSRSAHDTGVVHLPESTALIVGVGGIGSETARLVRGLRHARDRRRRPPRGAPPRAWPSCTSGRARRRSCPGPTSSSSPCRTRPPPRAS